MRGMKMSVCILAFAFCATTCFTGCFSIHSAQVPGEESEHLVVHNYGWYLFGLVPVGCGNASPDPIFPCVVFRDDVKMDIIQRIYLDYAAKKGKLPTNLAYDVKEDVMFTVPILGYSVPVPYLLTYKEMQLSGVLK